MARRVEVCAECETSFSIDLHTGEGECPLCSLDIQDSREVEYDDGNLRHYTLSDEDNTVIEHECTNDDYYDELTENPDDWETTSPDSYIPWD